MTSYSLLYLERPFDHEDLGALERIEKEAGGAQWDRDTLRWMTERVDIDTRVVVPDECSGSPIGFYVVEFGEEALYLCNLAVSPEWRRRGVAEFALNAAADLARSLNYLQLTLDVQEDNLPAQLLYRKNGFRVVQINRGQYRDQDGYHMVRALPS